MAIMLKPNHTALCTSLKASFKTRFLSGLFLAAVFTSQPLHAVRSFSTQDLPEFKAQYAVKKSGVKLAEATYQLSHTDTGYKFTQNSKLHGLAKILGGDTISAISYIDNIDGNLLLKKHQYVQTGREKNKNEDFSIQWNTSEQPFKGQITGTVRNKAIDIETDTAIWEPLSFQIPLMLEADKNTKEYPYNALMKGEIDNYNFVLVSSKSFTFANKDYQLLQMVQTDTEKNRALHIWLAPELNNLPVTIVNYRDGKEHSRMQLESVQFNDEQIIKSI